MSDVMDNSAPHAHVSHDPVDVTAMALAREWPHWPELHDVLWYRGVNLAEADEYLLFAGTMEALAASPPNDEDAAS